MPGHAIKQQTPAPAGAIEQLSNLLQPDMKQVNALILARMESGVPLIPKLASYLIAAGGKRIRPLLTLACTKIFDADITRAYRLAAAVEFIHTATLLHDDVVDESEQRRGQDAANLVFGNQASVLVGDFLFARSFQLMVEDGSLEVLRILSDAAATIAQGEVMQLSTANNLATSMGEYINVISAKTAALFEAACAVGPVIAEKDQAIVDALSSYGLNLGIAFQIADDALDYNADRAKLGKTVGDDFREGKMTAPVILVLQAASETEREFWKRTVESREQTAADLNRAQEILKKHDAIARSLALADDYAARARESLAPLPDHPLKDLLAGIVDSAVRRDH